MGSRRGTKIVVPAMSLSLVMQLPCFRRCTLVPNLVAIA
jgi:hypothetical protein